VQLCKLSTLLLINSRVSKRKAKRNWIPSLRDDSKRLCIRQILVGN